MHPWCDQRKQTRTQPHVQHSRGTIRAIFDYTLVDTYNRAHTVKQRSDMSEQNKAVVRRFMEALNEKNLSTLDEIFAPDYANHSPRLGVIGKEATPRDFEQTFKAFPDRHGIIEELMAEGDNVFLRQTTQTTHQQVIPGIPIEPTGKQISFAAWSVLRFEDGRIVERWAIHGLKEQVEAAARE